MGALVVMALALGVAALAAVVLAVLLLRAGRERTQTRAQLQAAREETAALHERLDAVVARLERPAAGNDERSYLITDVGSSAGGQERVPDRLVLSATVGEPLVRVAALAHGVRRALSPESRNRILFEMRREVRRARKQRRKDTRDAWRRTQAEQRAAGPSAEDAA